MSAGDSISRRTVYVDSAEEQYDWLLATFGKPGTWRVESQSYRSGNRGEELEVARVIAADGMLTEVIFAPARIDPDPFASALEEDDRTTRMDDLMEKATTFAAANPPHHPGSVARFPVPSAAYSHAVSVPLAVLAIDRGRRGLYAPPRVVALKWETLEPVGVGEFPGFDPEHWPPPRLGDWPPATTVMLDPESMQGTIGRFSACWSRILDAWFARSLDDDPVLRADAKEALVLRQRLDLPEMQSYYERLNPVFSRWILALGDG